MTVLARLKVTGLTVVALVAFFVSFFIILHLISPWVEGQREESSRESSAQTCAAMSSYIKYNQVSFSANFFFLK